MGLISSLDNAATFESPATLAKAIRMALADLIPDCSIFAEDWGGYRTDHPPCDREDDFVIRCEQNGERLYVRVMDMDDPRYEVNRLAGSIGYEKTAAALRVLNASVDEQRDAEHAARMAETAARFSEATDDDDAEAPDDDDDDDQADA